MFCPGIFLSIIPLWSQKSQEQSDKNEKEEKNKEEEFFLKICETRESLKIQKNLQPYDRLLVINKKKILIMGPNKNHIIVK